MMRKKLTILLLLFLSIHAFAQVPSYVPTSGLVGYWPFNGNANDESGNGLNGTVNGATLTTDRTGNNSQAYDFNCFDWSWGSGGDYVYIPYNPSLNSSSVTISAWFRKSADYISNQTYPTIVKRFEGGYNNPNGQTWGIFSDINGNNLNTFILPPNTTNNYSVLLSQAGPTISSNEWHNVILSFDGNSMKTYYDGQLISTVPSNGMALNSNGNSGVSVGMSIQANGHWDPFHGKIDDIGIWNRALTQQEITNIYTGTVPTPTCAVTATDSTICAGQTVTLTSNPTNFASSTLCASSELPSNLQTGLVGYWPFCGNANDASGNGNNGTVNGATLATDRFGNENSAYEFNGINCCGTPDPISEIVISNQLLNLGSNYTITCWMKSNNVQKYQQCLFNSINHTGFAVELNNEHVPSRLTFGVGPSNAFWDIIYAPGANTNYQNNQWYFVSFVKSGTTYSMYVNGVLDYSTSLANSVNYNQWVALRIGSIGGGNENFEGSLDDFATWNRALSNLELIQLYNFTSIYYPTTYLWSNGATTPSISISPTQTTTYTCTVTNNGVSCSDDVTINVDQLNFSLPSTTTECGATATLNAGNSGTSYLWNTGETNASISVANSGAYSCTVTNGACVLTDTTNLTLLNATISASDSIICSQDSVSISLINVPSFEQNSNCIGNAGSPNPWPYPSPADGGYINLGNFGAQNVFSISMWVNPGSTQNGVSILLDASHGGSLNWVVQAFGNNTYTWGSLNFNLTPNSWQHLLLTYENGVKKCYVNGQLVSTINQAISYSGSPNLYLGNWPEGGRRFNGLVDELYITTNVLYQSNFTPLSLISNGNASTFGLWHFDEGSGVNTLESNSNLSQTINGWFWSSRLITGLQPSILWSNGATTPSISVSPNQTTTYTCTVTNNGASCSDDVTIVVDTPPTPTITSSGSTNICSGNSITLTSPSASGNVWSTGATTESITVSNAGNFNVTVTNTSGCSATSTNTSVTVNALPTVNAGVDQTVCNGIAVTLSGVGANTYSWNNSVSNGVSFTPSVTTTYTVTGTDSNGCSNTDQVVVNVNALPAVNAGLDQTICEETTVTLSGSGATTYSWNNSVTNGVAFTPSASTTYLVTGTDGNGCSNTDEVDVNVNALPAVNAGLDQTICEGTTVTLSGSGSATYSWNNNVSNGVAFTPSVSTTYLVTGTDGNGCSNSDEVVVNVNALPAVNAGLDETVCVGQSTTLYGSGADIYSWSNNVSNGVGFLPTTTQEYVVTGTNASTGCSNVDTVSVTVNDLPTVSAGSDLTICKGDTIVLAGSGALTFAWNNNVIDGQEFVPAATQTYQVVGTDANNCTNSDETTISVNEASASTLTETALDMYVLNGQIFTQSGTYTQVIENVAGCDSTITLNLTLTFTGISEIGKNSFTVYPNPTNDVLNVVMPFEGNEYFVIIDSRGRKVLEGNLFGNENQISLKALSPGAYFLKIGVNEVPIRVIKQ